MLGQKAQIYISYAKGDTRSKSLQNETKLIHQIQFVIKKPGLYGLLEGMFVKAIFKNF